MALLRRLRWPDRMQPLHAAALLKLSSEYTTFSSHMPQTVQFHFSLYIKCSRYWTIYGSTDIYSGHGRVTALDKRCRYRLNNPLLGLQRKLEKCALSMTAFGYSIRVCTSYKFNKRRHKNESPHIRPETFHNLSQGDHNPACAGGHFRDR